MLLAPLIGHRGCAGLAPENTLAAIRMAKEQGLKAVELDVVLAQQGALVIFHDQNLARCTNIKKSLLEADLKVLKKLDVGSGFSKAFAGEPIPTLQEALVLVQQLDLTLNLEIKVHHHKIAPFVGLVLQQLSLYWQQPNKLLISSFDYASLHLCKELGCQYPLAILWSKLPANWQVKAKTLNAASIHLDGLKLNPLQAKQVKDQGFALYCYTINNELLAGKLKKMGVDGVFTDNPQLINSFKK